MRAFNKFFGAIVEKEEKAKPETMTAVEFRRSHRRTPNGERINYGAREMSSRVRNGRPSTKGFDR